MDGNLSAICRLCLQTGEQLQDLFNPDKNFVKIVEDLTGLKIMQESSFPSNVCCACLAHIDTLNNFKRTCLESDEALRENLVVFAIQIVDDNAISEKQLDEGVATREVKVNRKARSKQSYETGDASLEEAYSKPKPPRNKYNTPCHICGKLYARQDMKYHLNMHSGARPFICSFEDCAKSFTSPTNLASHHKMCHTDQCRFACDVCGRSFKVKTSFDIHRSYHFEPELPCNVCGKLLRHPRAVKRHMMSHTGERPYPCNKCTKSFQTNYTLRIHQRVHTKEKPFTCAICGKSFSYRCVLRTHMTSSHPDKSES